MVVKLSPPWVEHYHKISAFFKYDSEVKVFYDDDEKEVRLYVDNAKKANALSKLLPREKAFGNVVLKIAVIPADKSLTDEAAEAEFVDAFANNVALSYTKTFNTIMGKMTFIVFRNEVVQYWNDNLGDINGLCSTLYQDNQ